MNGDVVAARAEDMDAVATLLEASGLPVEGIGGDNVTVFVVRGRGGIAACGAVEMAGNDALLRSVAVTAAARGRGLGQRVTETALAHARRLGVGVVYLLTETAEGFFPRFGFEVTDRAGVPPEVAQTSEFSRLCPDSAVAMRLELAP